MNKSNEIYVNTQIKDESDLAELMRIYTNADAYNYERFPNTSTRKAHFKKNKEGVGKMCDIVEEYAKEYAKEYAEEQSKLAVRENEERMARKLLKEGMSMEIKKVALIGLGAMGVFFAPRLEEQLGRNNFCVVAKGNRKERLENVGVTINSVNYRFPICSPEDGTETDLIIMAVKDMGLDQAIQDIQNFVGENTQILCIMNGVESEEKVAAAYGWDHVMYSYMRMSIVMKNGKADFDPYWGKLYFGEARNEELTERVHAVAELMERCDIPYKVETDMIWGLWFKYMCNVGENLTCALLGIPFGVFRECEPANEIRWAAMKEVQAVAAAKGITITEEQMRRQYDTICRIPYENKPSTLQDLEAMRKTEIDMFAGSMVRMGEKLGIQTPICWMFLQGIKVLEEKNK